MKTPVYSGIIANYNCTAACRHCMFASSPNCGGGYISKERATQIAELLAISGCDSVHIGGGEPFMNFDGLCDLIRALDDHGIGIDYIETNASWCIRDDLVRDRLKILKSLGVQTVMASVDPFHIEYVPLERPLRMCRILGEMEMDYFIWQERYLRRLIHLDHSRTYTHKELCEILGDDYVTETAEEYGLGMNGRALAIADKMFEKKPVEKWLSSEVCSSLLYPRHCHIDLDGNAIPSGCPGLAAEAEDYLRGEFSEEKYPVFSRLVSGGIRELYDYAVSCGFTAAEEGYPSRCMLCWELRSFLLKKRCSRDLSPKCFYEEIEKLRGQ